MQLKRPQRQSLLVAVLAADAQVQRLPEHQRPQPLAGVVLSASAALAGQLFTQDSGGPVILQFRGFQNSFMHRTTRLAGVLSRRAHNRRAGRALKTPDDVAAAIG